MASNKPTIIVTTQFKWYKIPEQIYQNYNLVQLEVSSQAEAEASLKTKISEADAVIVIRRTNIDKHMLDLAPKLKIVANHGAGYDCIDHVYAEQKGIWVTNTPNIVNNATADIAVVLLLMVTRSLGKAISSVIQNRSFLNAGHFFGNDPEGKTIGILGMGRIGKTFAKRILGFDMSIIYYNRKRLPEEEEKQYGAKHVSKQELLSQSDYISIHLPLTKETHHFLTKDDFDQMKNGVVIINTSRGSVIDETALLEALKTGKVKGAGLDVVENEPKVNPAFFDFPNVILTPHIGTETIETRTKMEEHVLENVISVLSGNKPLSPVNNPKKKDH